MKLDSIVFQLMEVIGSLPTLLYTDACSPSVSITDLPQFSRRWLCEETWQPRSLEVHDLNVECTDSDDLTEVDSELLHVESYGVEQLAHIFSGHARTRVTSSPYIQYKMQFSKYFRSSKCRLSNSLH